MKACFITAPTLILLFSGGSLAQPAASPAPVQAPAPATSGPAPTYPSAQNAAPVYVPAQGAPAEETQPAYAPAAPTYYAPPPPIAEPRPGVRLHDGFYLRMSFGIGSGMSKLNYAPSGESAPDYKFSGTAAMFDVMIGGSPIPGFVLGGAIISHRILNPKVTYGGNQETLGNDVSANLTTFGLFAALYPDPRSGFNLHAIVGYGETSYTIDNMQSINNPVGLVVMGGLGYDFWVGDQWSLGPDLRIAYAKHSSTSGDYDIKATDFIPTLAFTATFN